MPACTNQPDQIDMHAKNGITCVVAFYQLTNRNSVSLGTGGSASRCKSTSAS